LFAVYLTTYSGAVLPPFYIGSSSIKKIKSGYHGSVKSKKYKSIWEEELKNNPHFFLTKILSFWGTREEALIEELRIQKEHDVVKSGLFINLAFACPNGFFGRDVSGENHPRYGSRGKEVSSETRLKLSNAFTGENNPMWGKFGDNHPAFGNKDTHEQRLKKSQRILGENNPMWGKSHTDITKEKISNKVSGELNGMFGKPRTEETRQKQSLSMQGKGLGKNKLNNTGKKMIVRLKESKTPTAQIREILLKEFNTTISTAQINRIYKAIITNVYTIE
jgi:hypothetical protein